MEFSANTPSFFEAKRFGVIAAFGTDAARFLHRMSTNSIETLEVGSSCLTAFLDQKGRLVAICSVLREHDQHFILLVPYDSAENLLQWLDQYLFVEDVTLADVSLKFSLIWTSDFDFPKLVTKEEAADFHADLKAKGSRELNEAEFESWRIAREIPLSINEINLNYHPLQLGFGSAIHWAKGCYIGQEVISRLESKDRAQKTLLGIKVTEPKWSALNAGDSITLDDGTLGTLTSVAPLYLAGQANALVVMKVRKSALTG